MTDSKVLDIAIVMLVLLVIAQSAIIIHLTQ